MLFSALQTWCSVAACKHPPVKCLAAGPFVCMLLYTMRRAQLVQLIELQSLSHIYHHGGHAAGEVDTDGDGGTADNDDDSSAEETSSESDAEPAARVDLTGAAALRDATSRHMKPTSPN